MAIIKTEEAADTKLEKAKREAEEWRKTAVAPVAHLESPQATLKVGNPSGLQPVEYKVLIKQDIVENTMGEDVKFVIPEDTREKEQWAEVKATLIAVGGKAFRDFGDPQPKPGDRVVVRQYAGYKIKGKDKIEYQVCNDKDITLIINEE